MPPKIRELIADLERPDFVIVVGVAATGTTFMPIAAPE